jgi:hypothetical protein
MTETTNEYIEELRSELQGLSLDAVEGDEEGVQPASGRVGQAREPGPPIMAVVIQARKGILA